MDDETQGAFDRVFLMYARANAYNMALQKLMEARLTESEVEEFRAELDDWQKRYYRIQIEKVEDIDPELAIRLQSLSEKKGKGQKPGESKA